MTHNNISIYLILYTSLFQRNFISISMWLHARMCMYTSSAFAHLLCSPVYYPGLSLLYSKSLLVVMLALLFEGFLNVANCHVVYLYWVKLEACCSFCKDTTLSGSVSTPQATACLRFTVHFVL